eukprot:sb/3468526/
MERTLSELVTGHVNNTDFERATLGRNCVYIVAAVILNNDNKILMIQEAKPSCRGLWYLPAGRVEKGESLVDAVKREVEEEAGVQFEPTGITFVEGNSLSHDVVGVIRESVETIKSDMVAPLPLLTPVYGSSISVAVISPSKNVLVTDGHLPGGQCMMSSLEHSAANLLKQVLPKDSFKDSDLQKMSLISIVHDGRPFQDEQGGSKTHDGTHFVYRYEVGEEFQLNPKKKKSGTFPNLQWIDRGVELSGKPIPTKSKP